jgi:hypothetical protein
MVPIEMVCVNQRLGPTIASLVILCLLYWITERPVQM